MSVRAKFKVESVTKRKGWSKDGFLYDVLLDAVTGESEENKRFFAATPSGNVRLSTVNALAGEQFEPGKEYYLDFVKVEDE